METRIIKKEHFKNIDFLRFVFAIIIVMYHGRDFNIIQVHNYFPHLKHGYFCVEFFFIIAGFFLFKNIKKDEDTIIFVKKRYLRLIIPVLISLIFVAIISLFIPEITFNFSENILKLFMLQTCGLSPFAGGLAGQGNWFVSVLFLTSIFYFYLYKITNKKVFNFVTALLVLFSYVLFLNFKGNNHWGLYGNLINIGLARGLGGLGIGYFISMLYSNNFLKTCTQKEKLIITGLEIYLLYFLTHYLLFTNTPPGKSNFLFIMTFAILFYLFLIKQGYLSKMLDNNILASLGKYSYTIYIMQFIILKLLKYTIYLNNIEYIKNHTDLIFCIQTIIVTLAGIIIYHTCEKPLTKYINKIIYKNNK